MSSMIDPAKSTQSPLTKLLKQMLLFQVPKPLEGQAESEFSCSNSLSGRRETAGSRAGLGLGEMVRKRVGLVIFWIG